MTSKLQEGEMTAGKDMIEYLTLQKEIRIIHHKLDYILEVMPHMHNLTQRVSVNKTKGYSFEKSKQAIKDINERLNENIKVTLDRDDTEN